MLAPGLRVESPAGSWTEIAFSDGSSVVLEPGADFTLRGIERDPGTGRLVVRAVSGRGQLRVSASGGLDIVIVTPGAEVRVGSASAVVNAGPPGFASLTAGRSVTVRRADGREDVIRRPGFSVAFDDGGPRRQSREQIAESVAPFAPVTATRGRGREDRATEVAEAPAFDPTQETARRNRSETVALPGVQGGQQGGGAGGGGRRGAAGFGLASASLFGGGALGSAFAAPGANSAATNVDAGEAGLFVSRGDQSGASIESASGATRVPIGIEQLQPFATAANQPITGRVRRFAPEASGANANRDDSGLVQLPGGSDRRTAGGLFQNFAQGSVASSLAAGQTFYDAVTNVGVVNLVVWQPRVASGQNGAGSDLAFTPRFYVTDSNLPVAARSPSPTFFAGRQLSGGGTPVFEYYRNRDGTQVTTNQSEAFEFPLAERARNPALRPGFTFFDAAFNNPTSAYSGGSVFEVGLQSAAIPGPGQPSNGRIAITNPPSATGDVFRLSGGNGLAMYQGPPLSRVEYETSDVGINVRDPFRIPISGATVIDPATRVANVAPGVFIIDKFTVSNDVLRDTRGIQAGERYFVIGGTPVPLPGNRGLPGPNNAALGAGTVSRFAVSDGLNTFAGFVEGRRIENQFRTPGAPDQIAAFREFNAFRPEITFVPSSPRGDTHLIVVAGANDRNPAMRVDLQVAADGRSSASVATGSFGVLPVDVSSIALSGNAVGSTRAGTPSTDTSATLRQGSVAISSALGSLGTDQTGYGAHVFGGSSAASGQMGYFAVSQADVRRGLPGQDSGQPGNLTALGGPSSQFGFTRLATNVGAPNLGLAPGQVGNLQGFASGVVEPTAAGGARQDLYAVAGNVAVQPRNANEFTAGLTLFPRALGEVFAEAPAAEPPAGRAARTLSFGADSNGLPTTAVATPGTFAGVIPGQAAMASVNADLLAGIRRPDGSATNLPPSSEHLAWGFFLGDLVAQANGSPREYANLGFWVAGRPVDAAALQSLTGSATYAGGMIGNVVDGRGLRSVAGDFSHAFNFGTRQGNFSASFDGAGFGIGTGVAAGAGTFSGSGAGDAGRVLTVQGGFFNNGGVSSGNLPRATGGIFGIAGQNYGANGVFVGARP
ncbi:hypothetical protein [Falsiroseomonas sp. CW058]|uniref:hypothetical protein n=1 Tax=Falsiroseomonas sp. CW058 TaxID=3388664 RepID=UPI003D31808E